MTSTGMATPSHTPSTIEILATQAETTNTASSLILSLPYAFTPMNFFRLAKRVDHHETQMKLLSYQMWPFIIIAIAAALVLYSDINA